MSYDPAALEFAPRTELELEVRAGRWFQRIAVGPQPIVFGRSTECDVQLTDPSLSRRHAQIVPEGDGWLVEDLGSQSGTMLNGGALRQPSRLQPGDRLQVGPFSVRVVRRTLAGSALTGDAERDSRNIDLVLRTISDLYGPGDLTQLLQTIVDRTIVLAGADRGAILLEGGQGTLEIAVARDAGGGDLSADQLLSSALPDRALATGHAIVLTDAESPEQRHAASESVHQGRLRSVLCVPLPGPQKPIGVLYADGRRPVEEFGGGELAVFEALAVHGAVAIERARLREDQTRREHQARRRLEAENAALRAQLGTDEPIAESEPMRRVLEMLRRVAPSNMTVCLIGETGTGKEVLARYLHRLSPRNARPFVVIDCGALPEGLIESELFGHRKGAYTGAADAHDGLFQAAQGGTIFLDEIAELSPSAQTKLLRVLQERTVMPLGETRRIPVDVRVVCASHRDLAKQVAEGKFREDLYYRVSVLSVPIPPLRERGEDILLLAQHFLTRWAVTFGTEAAELTPQARAALLEHSWPGNVRELENRVQRAALLARPPGTTRRDLGFDIPRPPHGDDSPDIDEPPTGLQQARMEANLRFERMYLERVLRFTNGNVSRAAEVAGVSRQLLRRLLRRQGVDRRCFADGTT